METEIREMLRSKAGDAVLSPVIPLETVSRANRRRAFVATSVGLAAAAVIVGVIVGVNSLSNRRTIGFDDQPIEPKRKLGIELFQGPYGIVEGFDSVWVAGRSDVARIDPRTGAVKRTITFTSAPRVVDGTTERDFYEVVPSTLTAGEGAVWVLGEQRGTNFSTTAEPLAPSETGEPQTSATFSMSASTSTTGDEVTLRGSQLSAIGDWALIRIDPDDYSWRVVGHVPFDTPTPPRTMKAGEGGIWIAIENASGGSEIRRLSPRNGGLAATFSLGSRIPTGIAIDGGWVYVSLIGQGDGVVRRIDPATNRTADAIKVGNAVWSSAIAASDGDVWVSVGTTEGGPYRVARVDARSGRLLGAIEVPSAFGRLSADGGTLWGLTQGDESIVQRIVGNALAGSLSTRFPPGAILARNGSLWAGGAESELTLTRYDF